MVAHHVRHLLKLLLESERVRHRAIAHNSRAAVALHTVLTCACVCIPCACALVQYFSADKADGVASATVVQQYVPCWEKALRVSSQLDKDTVNHVVLSMILDS